MTKEAFSYNAQKMPTSTYSRRQWRIKLTRLGYTRYTCTQIERVLFALEDSGN
jgi:hypothetical protein